MFTLEIIGWAALLGGIPATGYYLFKHGQKLIAQRKSIGNAVSDRDSRRKQYYQELLYLVNCTLLAGTGLALCHFLERAVSAQ